MVAIPPFTQNGLLPDGVYELSIDELLRSELVLGHRDPEHQPTWDAAWRERLVRNLSVLVSQLRQVGVMDVFIDGSFTEDKDHPNDIDGYFVCDAERFGSGEIQRELNRMDEHKVWTWEPTARRPFPGSHKNQLPMWHRYRVELYPHTVGGGRRSALSHFGHDLGFPAAFRRCRRSGRPKGIVKINLGDQT